MIKQLREFHDEQTLKQIYAKPHDHAIYGRGHGIRVETTKALAKDMASMFRCKSVADLSCGNGAIAKSLGIQEVILGDFAPKYQYVGPLEENLPKIKNVDMYVCSETLEHLEDPLGALKMIREKSCVLVLSTPIENWNDTNAEHYWSWDRDGIESLLSQSGWTPNIFAYLDTTVFGEPYIYGMWGCK